MSPLEVVVAAGIGAVLGLGAFLGWVWWEWCARPARIARRYRDG